MEIFISHSSKDIKIVKELNTMLSKFGIDSSNIFCSSIEGQGVKNGERIAEDVVNKFNSAHYVIYLITQNFLKSNYCIQESGFICQKNNNQNKSYFIFKTKDVDDNEIKGFFSKEYKYSDIDTSGLMELYDSLNENYSFNKKMTLVNSIIGEFLNNIKIERQELIENKSKSSEELKKEKRENLEKQYYLLSEGQKNIIAEIYFSWEGVAYYNITDGVVGSLYTKLFLIRTSQATCDYSFAYTLQSWVIEFINREQSVKDELKNILNKNGKNKNHQKDLF